MSILTMYKLIILIICCFSWSTAIGYYYPNTHFIQAMRSPYKPSTVSTTNWISLDHIIKSFLSMKPWSCFTVLRADFSLKDFFFSKEYAAFNTEVDEYVWRQADVTTGHRRVPATTPAYFSLVKTELKNWKPLNRPTNNLIYIHDKEKMKVDKLK